MEGAIHGLQGIFEVIIIIGIGFVLAKKNWFDTKSSALLTRFIMNVSLPIYLFCSIQKDFSHDKLVAMAPDLVLPFCSIIAAYLIGRLAVKDPRFVYDLRAGRTPRLVTQSRVSAFLRQADS